MTDAQAERYYRSRFAVIQRTPSCCDTTDAQTERPYKGLLVSSLLVSLLHNGRITAFDGWICRVDVIRVGADLRVRPQNRLRSGEDRRTHRSAPTVGAPTPLSGSPEEQSTELPKREKTSLFTCI